MAGRPRVADSVLDLIGNTPLVRLGRIAPAGSATILAKVESQNPGGSVKDRIARSMIEDAERRGALRPGSTLVEPTSGNTGHRPGVGRARSRATASSSPCPTT